MFNKSNQPATKDKSSYIVELSKYHMSLEDRRFLENTLLWFRQQGLDDPNKDIEELKAILLRIVYILDHMRHYEVWRFLIPGLLRLLDRLELAAVDHPELKKDIELTYERLLPREWLQRFVEFEPVLGEPYPSWVLLTDLHPKYLPTYSDMYAAQQSTERLSLQKAPVTHLIIFINLIVFLLVNFRSDSRDIMNHWGLSSGMWLDGRALSQGYGLSLISHMFLHQGWMHLIANMVTLLFVGPPVEQKLGKYNYLVLYLLAGILGGLSHLVLFQGPAIFNDVNQFLLMVQANPENMYYYYPSAVGASGAISGVLAGVVILYPTALLYLMGLIRLTIPQFAWGFLIIHIIMLAITIMNPTSMVKVVAWHSHLVGFIFGYIWILSIYKPERKISI